MGKAEKPSLMETGAANEKGGLSSEPKGVKEASEAKKDSSAAEGKGTAEKDDSKSKSASKEEEKGAKEEEKGAKEEEKVSEEVKHSSEVSAHSKGNDDGDAAVVPLTVDDPDPYIWEAGNSSVRKPNLILWVTDDQGWSNVGYNNHVVYTPTMDSLAKEGIKLQRHYTACWCVPSRASLMTGRLPYHMIQNGGEMVPKNIQMLPAILKKAGYATAMVGKWHLGNFREWQLPTSRGFDRSFGFLGAAADYYTHEADASAWPCDGKDLWSDTGPAMSRDSGKDISTKMHSFEASAVITQHARTKKNVPLFMYVALQAMHSPQPNPPVNTERYANFTDAFAVANGLISAADEALYDVTKTLRAENMWSDTLIVHTADNGGSVSPLQVEVRGTNYPLRGGKNTNFEGGVRVPAFLTGGFIPPSRRGQMLDGYIHLADWYSTFAELAGMRLSSTSAQPDGINMWPYIAGYPGSNPKFSPRSDILLSTISNKAGAVDALILDSYKLIVGKPLCDGYTTAHYPENNTLTHTLNCNPAFNSLDGVGASTWLFNIRNDPEERNNIASLYVHKVNDMKAIIEERRASQVKYSDPDSWDPTLKSKCEAYTKAHNGFLGPFMKD